MFNITLSNLENVCKLPEFFFEIIVYIFSIQFTSKKKYVSCTDSMYGHRPYVFFIAETFENLLILHCGLFITMHQRTF